MAEQVLADEKAIILKLKAGDEPAFERLYHYYAPKLYRNIWRLMREDDDAKEIMQELFIKLWQKREGIDPEQSLGAYLHTLARNLIYDQLRHRQTVQKTMALLGSQQTEGYRHVAEELEYKETAARLQQAIESLPPKRKQVYILCKLEGKSYMEVGRMLGITISAVNAHVVKATKAIREQIDLPDLLVLLVMAGWLG